MWQETHVSAYPAIYTAVLPSNQPASWEVYVLFLLQRDAPEE